MDMIKDFLDVRNSGHLAACGRDCCCISAPRVLCPHIKWYDGDVGNAAFTPSNVSRSATRSWVWIPSSLCKCYLYYISFLCTLLLSPWCSYRSCTIGAWRDFIFCGKLMRVGIFAFANQIANMSSLKYTDVALFLGIWNVDKFYAVEWQEARGRRKTESMSTNTRKVQSHIPTSDSCQTTFLCFEPIYVKDILWRFARGACPHRAILQMKVSVN